MKSQNSNKPKKTQPSISSPTSDNLPIMEEIDNTTILSPTRTPHFPNSPVSAPPFDPSSLKINFLGWKTPQDNWKTWVNQMHPLHHSTWKNLGILDAIMSSKNCIIHRHQNLLFGFVWKWRPVTNTLVFPWGEATITLEDVTFLGGYPVSGESIFFDPPNDDEAEAVTKELLEACSSIYKSKSRKATHSKWIAKFMGIGNEIEHVAFLAYWLSRFVFPFKRDIIIRSVFPIAIHLARGTRIALAPAVLACIYKSLTLLQKAAIVASRKKRDFDQLNVSGQLALFQVWVWERFPSFRPNPISIGEDEPRLGRWHNLKKEMGFEDVLLRIDSAREEFQWCPYSSNLEGIIGCLRTSDLVSLEGDCVEHYMPQRVAKQFGLDHQELLLDEQVGMNWKSPLSSTADCDYGNGSYCKGSLKRKFVESSSDYDYDRGVSPPPGFSPNEDNGVIIKSFDSSNGIEKTVADSSSNIGIDGVNNYQCEDGDHGQRKIEALGIGSLEERIRIVEKLCALLKAEKLVCL